MKDYQDIPGLVAIYVGAVVGAGFATGQEVNQFFVHFGLWGFAGVVIAVICIAVMSSQILDLAYTYHLSDYQQGLQVFLGPNGVRAGDCLVGLFLFGGLAIMIAGGGEALSTIGIARPVASALFTLTIFLGISGGPRRLIQVNKVLVPLLISVIVLLIGARTLNLWKIPVSAETIQSPLFAAGVRPVLLPNWLMAAVLYAAFNLGIVFTVFSSLGEYISDHRSAKNSGLISGLVLGMLLLFFYWGILSLPGASEEAIPMAYVASFGPLGARWAYLGLLVLAMFTSAVASGYALIRRYKWWFKDSAVFAAIILLALGWILAQGGFVALVSTIYPVYGYLWAVLLMILLVKRTFAGCVIRNSE